MALYKPYFWIICLYFCLSVNSEEKYTCVDFGERLDSVQCAAPATIHVTSVKQGYSMNGCEDAMETGCTVEASGSHREFIIQECEGKHKCDSFLIPQIIIKNCTTTKGPLASNYGIIYYDCVKDQMDITTLESNSSSNGFITVTTDNADIETSVTTSATGTDVTLLAIGVTVVVIVIIVGITLMIGFCLWKRHKMKKTQKYAENKENHIEIGPSVSMKSNKTNTVETGVTGESLPDQTPDNTNYECLIQGDRANDRVNVYETTVPDGNDTMTEIADNCSKNYKNDAPDYDDTKATLVLGNSRNNYENTTPGFEGVMLQKSDKMRQNHRNSVTDTKDAKAVTGRCNASLEMTRNTRNNYENTVLDIYDTKPVANRNNKNIYENTEPLSNAEDDDKLELNDSKKKSRNKIPNSDESEAVTLGNVRHNYENTQPHCGNDEGKMHNTGKIPMEEEKTQSEVTSEKRERRDKLPKHDMYTDISLQLT